MAPDTLQSLQRDFQHYLLHDATAGFVPAVRSGFGIAAERRLRIYHHAYRARLAAALADTYAHTAQYLGEAWFDADALAFVQATPSRHPSLNDYGRELPDWLARRYPHDADISELAMLDWALRRAFDGPDAAVLTLASLAAVEPSAWERIGLALHPTARTLPFTRNTLALWSALDQDEPPPTTAVLAQPQCVLVWRRGHQPNFRSLTPLEAAALAQLQSGASFAAMCGTLALAFPQADVAAEAGTLLRRWTDDELLSAIVDPDVPP